MLQSVPGGRMSCFEYDAKASQEGGGVDSKKRKEEKETVGFLDNKMLY